MEGGSEHTQGPRHLRTLNCTFETNAASVPTWAQCCASVVRGAGLTLGVLSYLNKDPEAVMWPPRCQKDVGPLAR